MGLIVAGVDEAGRGALAGPVVAAAVIFPEDCDTSSFCDSKTLTAAQRDSLYDLVFSTAVSVGVGVVEVKEIETLNILKATLLAMEKAVYNLSLVPNEVWIDGNSAPDLRSVIVKTFVKGDALHSVISAASIVAKVTRDRIMDALDVQYPGYGFLKHKGYGTEDHYQRVFEMGPSLVHRKTFNLTRQLSLF